MLWDRVRSSRLRLLLAFTLSCIFLYILIDTLPPPVTRPLDVHVAQMLGLVLNSLDIPVITAGNIVSGKGLSFMIIPECTPIFTVALFVSFVAFHPASIRQKATGLAWGIPTLYLGNLLRLVATFAISRYDSRLFDVTHVYLGQIFTMFLVILCCILWMRWHEREGRKKGDAMNTSIASKREGGFGREKKEVTPGTAMNAAWFIVRFGLISTGLFIIWVKVHHGYIRLLDWFIGFGFSIFGRSAQLAHETAVYYETFSIVIVVSLVLSARSMPWRRRIPLLGAALAFLILIQILHRIDNILLALYHVTIMQKVDLAVLVIGQYLIPVLLLIFLARFQMQDIQTGRLS